METFLFFFSPYFFLNNLSPAFMKDDCSKHMFDPGILDMEVSTVITKSSLSTINRLSQPSRVVVVKKTGPNKGRRFFSCCRPRQEQCDFFM
jgi:hypothetical protein